MPYKCKFMNLTKTFFFYLYVSVNFTICIYVHPVKKYRHLKCQNNLKILNGRTY